MNALRFLAAFLVVIFHLRTLFIEDFSQRLDPTPFATAMYAIMSLGHQAVIVFFVLSGFWVGGSVIRALQRKAFSGKGYAVARVVRLWVVLVPAVVLTLILDAVGQWMRPDSDIYVGSLAYHSLIPETGVASRTNLATAVGNVFFVQDLYVPSIGSNSPLWSLATEFWYYLAFPSLLVLFWPRISWRARVTAGAVALITIVLIAMGPIDHGARVFVLAPTWAVGAAVAAVRGRLVEMLDRIPVGGLRALRTALGLVTLAAAIIDSRVWSTATTYLLAMVAAGWIATLVTDTQNVRVRRALAPVSGAADWSYSLYATHMPVLALVAALVVPQAEDRWPMVPTTAAACAGIAVISLAVAILFWLAFENNTKRVRNWLQLLGSRRAPR